MSRSLVFLASDAARAVDEIICKSEDYGDNAVLFVEEVRLELRPYVEQAKKAGGSND